MSGMKIILLVIVFWILGIGLSYGANRLAWSMVSPRIVQEFPRLQCNGGRWYEPTRRICDTNLRELNATATDYVVISNREAITLLPIVVVLFPFFYVYSFLFLEAPSKNQE